CICAPSAAQGSARTAARLRVSRLFVDPPGGPMGDALEARRRRPLAGQDAGTERPLLLRLRQEVQALLRSVCLMVPAWVSAGEWGASSRGLSGGIGSHAMLLTGSDAADTGSPISATVARTLRL